jgi:nucleotide-binding universal stress UspA family protein
VKTSDPNKSPLPLRAAAAPHQRRKTILVPIDFSPASQHGLAQAIAFGRGSRLILLHVVAAEDETGERLAIMIHYVRARLSQFAQSHGRGADCTLECRVSTGTPFQEILSFAKKERTDLIVLAVDPSSSLGGIALGHTADRVLRYASSPVLLVREGPTFSSPVPVSSPINALPHGPPDAAYGISLKASQAEPVVKSPNHPDCWRRRQRCIVGAWK